MVEGAGEGRPVRVPGAPVALSTASVYPQTCADTFAFAAELGYDGVEVMVWTDPISQEAPSLRGLIDHYRMPVLAIHAPTLLVTQRVWGREPWEKLRRSCRLAAELGAGTVVVHPPFRWQREYAAGFVEGVELLSGQDGQPCGDVLGLLADRNWTGTVVVEVNTRRARTRAQRESDLAEALAFARLHLASRAPA